MNKKLKVKTGIDLLMFIALMLLMPYEMVGESAHEWIGMAMFVLFIFHHVMNRKWTGDVFHGKYSPIRLIQTFLVVILLILMLGSMGSGILLSRYLFKDVNIVGTANAARNVHMICAYWGMVLMAVHLGFHWNMFLKMIEKKTGVWNRKVQWILRIVAVAVAAYGALTFEKRKIANYMFLRSHFVFFDFMEPLGYFMLDYLAIMVLFVFVGHYLAKSIRKVTFEK